MKHLPILAVALACSPLILAFQQPATKIAFNVEQGTTLKKVFTSRLNLGLDEMRVLRNGQEPDMLPELEMNVVTDFKVSVEDQYVALRSSAPSKLRRTYQSVQMSSDMSMEMDQQGNTSEQDSQVKATSKLEGEVVDFIWNEKEQRFDLSFANQEGDQELLIGLNEDMDLRAFLPDHEVAIGDRWEVAPQEIGIVLAPGGDLKLDSEDAGYDMNNVGGQMGDLNDWFDKQLEGKVTCLLREVRDEDETRVAVIAIEYKLKNDVDLTEHAQEQLDQVELPAGAGKIEVSRMHVNLGMKGEGVLLWDLQAGHFHSLNISGDLDMKMGISLDLEMPSFGDVSTQLEFDMSGNMTFGAEIQ